MVYLLWCSLGIDCDQKVEAVELSARQLAIEATFTVGIADYVTWKSAGLRDQSQFTILVLDDDAFAEALAKVSRLKSDSRRNIEIKRVEHVDQLELGHMLYVGDVSENEFQQALSYCRKEGILLISNREDFVDRGGLIQFIQLNNRLRFVINQKGIDDFNIRISSKLMKLSYQGGVNG